MKIRQQEINEMDIIMPVILIAAYIVIMKFVLPKLGVPTWMSNACDVQDDRRKESESEKQNWVQNLWMENLNADIWV